MMENSYKVTMEDGVIHDIHTNQFDFGQFEIWARKKGFEKSESSQTIAQDLSITFIRYTAYSAMKRSAIVMGRFEDIDQQIMNVDPVEKETPLNPTEPDLSD